MNSIHTSSAISTTIGTDHFNPNPAWLSSLSLLEADPTVQETRVAASAKCGWKRDRYTVSEDGHFIGDDGFIVPRSFDEFIERYPYLFLDEFDKIKLDSEFQAKEFSTLIDVIQSNGGVVVASSNLGEYDLTRKLGDQFGLPVIRRLTGARLNSDTPDQPTNSDRNGSPFLPSPSSANRSTSCS